MSTKTIVTIVELAGALLYCWWLYSEIAKSDENLEAEFWLGVSRFCQTVARWFGSIGLTAEIKYRETVDNGRMI